MKKILLTAFALGLATFTNAQNLKTSCFHHATDYPSRYPYDINKGDYNGDGFDDFAVMGLFNDTISVYINQGLPNGFNFYNPVTYSTATIPRAITSADFNKDGKTDIACVNGNPNDIKELKVFYGNVSSMTYWLSSVPTQTAGEVLSKIITKDLNNDTYEDAVVLTLQNTDSRIYTYLNNSGTLALNPIVTSVLSVPAANLNAADIIDVDGDGNKDYVGVVVPNGTGGTNFIAIKHGLGNGNFSSTTTTLTVPFNNSQSIFCADLNNDGLGDIIMGGMSGKLAIITATTGGNFNAATTYTTLTGDSQDIEYIDMNNDGFKDIVTTGVNSTKFNILYGTATPLVFSTPHTYNSGSIFAEKMAIADYNLDGTKDILTNNSAHNTIGINLSLNPAISPISTNTFCTGQPANLFSQHPFGNEFQWLPSGGNSSMGTFYNSGTYTLVLSDAASNCSIASTPVTLTEVNCTTGLDELPNNIFNIYPNPTNGIINIDLETINDNMVIELRNALGQIVLSEKVTTLHTQLNTNNLLSGVYFIKVGNTTKKIIKE